MPRAAVRSSRATLTSLSVWKLFAAAATPRPAASNVTPEIDCVDVPVSLNTTVRLSPLSRLTPL